MDLRKSDIGNLELRTKSINALQKKKLKITLLKITI